MQTDGFFAAYAVYVALVLVASALRVVVLPQFARAHEAGRLGREVGSWSLALAVLLVPAVVLAIAASGTLARGLAGGGDAQDAAAELLPWLVPAAAAQVYAGIAASGLAALGDYGTAALGFGLGAVAGLVVIVAARDHGVVAFGWGLALNGAIASACRWRSFSSVAASAVRSGASGRACASSRRACRCRSRSRACT